VGLSSEKAKKAYELIKLHVDRVNDHLADARKAAKKAAPALVDATRKDMIKRGQKTKE
jgi:hypothetical protein